METYNITKIIADIEEKVRIFAQDHSDETFYAFALDAGMLCLSSEEGFTTHIQKCIDRWYESHSQMMTRADLEERMIEHLKQQFEKTPKEMLKYHGNASTADEYIDHYVEEINEDSRDSLEDGCLYEDKEKVTSLRYSTGDWPYQGFADLKTRDLEISNETHYNLNDEEQNCTEYSELIIHILSVIERNKESVFASLKRSDDFQVLQAKHDY